MVGAEYLGHACVERGGRIPRAWHGTCGIGEMDGLVM